MAGQLVKKKFNDLKDLLPFVPPVYTISTNLLERMVTLKLTISVVTQLIMILMNNSNYLLLFQFT